MALANERMKREFQPITKQLQVYGNYYPPGCISLGRVEIFPIISGGVMYSFSTPWQGTPKARF